MIVRVADLAELPDVLRVQHEAFRRVAEEFGIAENALDPLRETLDELQALCGDGTLFFVALDEDGHIVGTVRGTASPDGVVDVNRLAVATSALRQGVATRLMRALESSFAPEAHRFELFTGEGATAPLELYCGLDYRQFRREVREHYTLVHLCKDVAPDG